MALRFAPSDFSRRVGAGSSCNPRPYSDPNSYVYTNSNGASSNADAYGPAEVYPDAAAATDAGASSVELSGFVREGTRERKLACPTPEVARVVLNALADSCGFAA